MVDIDKIIRKYYADNTKLYTLLMQHSKAVADKAMEVVVQKNLQNIDKDFLYEAAMLHDIGVFLCHAPDIYCYGTHQYLEHGYLGAELLRKEGLGKLALVCERHIGVGLSKETIIKNMLPLPHKDMIPISLEEEVIAYADLFFSKSSVEKIFTPDEVRQKLAKHGEENVEIFNAWHKKFS